MVDSDNSTNNYKALKRRIGVLIKSKEMLKFVPDHVKTKKMCKNAIKKLLFLIMFVPD